MYNKLREFLPETPLMERSLLNENEYVNQVPQAIKRWLIQKFAYPAEELEGKGIAELVDILKEQFAAAKPYHRSLYLQFKSLGDDKSAKFVKYFLDLPLPKK